MSFYYLTPTGRNFGGEPVIPLPYPGEGGPVYPGDDPAAEPVVPLPFPGEGDRKSTRLNSSHMA